MLVLVFKLYLTEWERQNPGQRSPFREEVQRRIEEAEARIAAALVACSSDSPTEIVVRITSDLQIPAEIDGLGLRVEYWGALRFDQSYDLDPAKPGAVSLPTTVGLVAGDDPRQLVLVVASATKDGHQVLTSSARALLRKAHPAAGARAFPPMRRCLVPRGGDLQDRPLRVHRRGTGQPA